MTPFFLRCTASLALIAATTPVQAQAAAACTFDSGVQYYEAKDFARASACLAEGAARDDLASLELLGTMRLNGQGGPQDVAQAHALFLRAADKGSPAAAHNVGLMHQMGMLGKVDLANTLKYYRIAADKGSISAQVSLAIMYMNGAGVAVDNVAAENLLMKAAKAGDGQAQYNLATLYGNGLRPEQDPGVIGLLRRAAANGHRQSPEVLGKLYAAGNGVKPDLVEAYTWFLISDARGNAEAGASLAALGSKLDETERQLARTRMTAWVAQRRQEAQDKRAAASPAATYTSRCAVMVDLQPAPAPAGATGEVLFNNLWAKATTRITALLVRELSNYRVAVVNVNPADSARVASVMNDAMTQRDCTKAMALTFAHGKDASGAFVRYTLSIYQKPAGSGAPATVIRSKESRTDMSAALDGKLDFRAVAKFFADDAQASGLLNGILK